MNKPTSQWDFGELFPVEATRHVLSVSDLTTQIKRLLEKSVGLVWVSGEITNLRTQSSGHIYFTLKDVGSQLSCVLFRSTVTDERHLLADGQKVLLQGDVTVYEARGQYQLIVRAIELQGVGALQLKFEKLKQKLAAEGLFEPERKRPLPRYPHRIGLVTSSTGAAIRDVLHVIHRRDPRLEIILAPCSVQGTCAGSEIAAAIRLLNEFAVRNSEFRIDLILVTRGGGSLEDLWAFNEEIVARAIFESALPIVSAVGHEIDFTISDFVADVRAATPSAAAEIITEGVFSSCEFISESAERMRYLIGLQFTRKTSEFTQMKSRVARMHPRRRLNESLQRLDDLQSSLGRCAKQSVRERLAASRNILERLRRVRPAQLLHQRREVWNVTHRRLLELTKAQLHHTRSRLAVTDGRLRLLGPEQVLARGYSITLDAQSGAVVRTATAVKPGQQLRTRLQTGEIKSRVEP